VHREPVTGPRSWGIVNQHPAINNKLATKPTPEPNPNPTLTLTLTLTLTKLLVPKKRKTDRQITNRLNIDAILFITPTALGAHSLVGVPYVSQS